MRGRMSPAAARLVEEKATRALQEARAVAELLEAIAAMETERGRAWPGDAERRVYELARAMRPAMEGQ